MDDRRSLVLLAALLSLVVTTGCAGVPKSGAVHRLRLPANQPVVAGVAQAGPLPQPHQTQTEVVQSLLLAMSQHDTNVVAQYLTPDYAPQWQATSSSQTVVFSEQKALTLKAATQVDVDLTQTGLIDASQTYLSTITSTPTDLPVTFTLALTKGTWQVSHISQPGLFVSEDDLPDFLTPWHVYFPSSAASGANVRRLVPDTIFLPPGSSPNYLIGQLLDGPSDWLKPAVYVTVAPSADNKVNQVTQDARNLLTTVDLHVAGKPLSSDYIATLKAQIAYTLNVQSFHTGSIQLEVDGRPQGGTYTLAQLPKGYDPDVLPVQAPVYYVAGDQKVVASTPLPPTTAAALSGVPAGGAADTIETVLAHDDGVQQLAVASPTEQGAIETQMLAGVRNENGTATLELATANILSDHPWQAVTLPEVAKTLSTPSFDVPGSGVWTVATAPNGTTTIYRIPLVGGQPGTPQVVVASKAQGVVVPAVTALKLSRDGSRAALIVKTDRYSLAYVGVVNHPATAVGGAWSITSLRPVIGVSPGDTDVDVVWADQSEIGVVVQNTTGKVVTTKVYRVSSDGYTVSADGSIGPILVDGAPSQPTAQLAAGPRQPWVASVSGKLTRQPTTDSFTDTTSTSQSAWTALDTGTGSYPTYAG
ncbi:hypothetical protein acdb102_30010 [Acidothermaceae bacterium B102]|nr:hypothetical protein acdb102_30010 [Acidothermaceae bacterium B102]